MIDPLEAVAAAGWAIAVLVGVLAKIRSQRNHLDEGTVAAVRRAVQEEVRPVHDIADRVEHEIAVLRQEIGFTQARTEFQADQLRTVGGKVDKVAEQVRSLLGVTEHPPTGD